MFYFELWGIYSRSDRRRDEVRLRRSDSRPDEAVISPGLARSSALKHQTEKNILAAVEFSRWRPCPWKYRLEALVIHFYRNGFILAASWTQLHQVLVDLRQGPAVSAETSAPN